MEKSRRTHTLRGCSWHYNQSNAVMNWKGNKPQGSFSFFFPRSVTCDGQSHVTIMIVRNDGLSYGNYPQDIVTHRRGQQIRAQCGGINGEAPWVVQS